LNNAPTFPQLTNNGSNWDIYKLHLVAAIRVEGLTEHLDGRSCKPAKLVYNLDGSASLPDGTTLTNGDEIECPETELDDYAQRDATVREYIYSTIPNILLLRVMKQPTAASVWNTISQLYEAKNEIQVQVDVPNVPKRPQTRPGDVLKAKECCTVTNETQPLDSARAKESERVGNSNEKPTGTSSARCMEDDNWKSERGSEGQRLGMQKDAPTGMDIASAIITQDTYRVTTTLNEREYNHSPQYLDSTSAKAIDAQCHAHTEPDTFKSEGPNESRRTGGEGILRSQTVAASEYEQPKSDVPKAAQSNSDLNVEIERPEKQGG
jgi:hypothetical protein